MKIRLKRVYGSASKEDGCRVLVDRLWPRGISREKANIDVWLKEAAPSTPLRKWFGHDREKWKEFEKRYFVELDANPAILRQFVQLAKRGVITLVYGAKDEIRNNAVALREYLERRG